MNPNELTDNIHTHLNKYIISADRKASILLTAQFAFLGLSANALSGSISEIQDSTFIFVIIGSLCGLFGLIFAILVIYPRESEPVENMMYWSHIQSYDSWDKFRDDINELSDSDRRDELIKQNYALSKVAVRKYTNLRISLIFTGGMLLSAVLVFALYID